MSLFKKDEMTFFNDGKPFNETALILGPGTGLGAAQVIRESIVLPTEIGNSSFIIPELFLELGLEDKDYNVVEDLISGGGLAKIYSFFAVGPVKNKTAEKLRFKNPDFQRCHFILHAPPELARG